jgi:hypothetical protein
MVVDEGREEAPAPRSVCVSLRLARVVEDWRVTSHRHANAHTNMEKQALQTEKAEFVWILLGKMAR